MKKVVGIALAFTIIAGVVIVAEGPELQTANSANAYSMTLDRCPYYPSPVVCHNGSADHTAFGSLTTPSQPSHATVGG
jgi:hypothetical protein